MAVKIQVFGADGIYRGGLFSDHLDRKYRWTGVAKPGLEEVMVCCEEPADGTWYLLELVLPRTISGSDSNDSLFDERSRCFSLTLPQALCWFHQQRFGPPPQLVKRVQAFAADWEMFKGSEPARRLLNKLVTDRPTSVDAPFLGKQKDELDLLRRLELLLFASGSGTTTIYPRSVVEDMGIDAFVDWTDTHLAQATLPITARRETGWPKQDATGARTSPGNPTPLHFARSPDAKHKCLEALAHAPNGIPRHQDMADATGLEYQTVKEVMPRLRKAGHVEKRDGAWEITPAGIEHLKRLRGE